MNQIIIALASVKIWNKINECGILVFTKDDNSLSQDQINIDNLIVSNKPSPEGWADVIKMALVKLDFKD